MAASSAVIFSVMLMMCIIAHITGSEERRYWVEESDHEDSREDDEYEEYYYDDFDFEKIRPRGLRELGSGSNGIKPPEEKVKKKKLDGAADYTDIYESQTVSNSEEHLDTTSYSHQSTNQDDELTTVQVTTKTTTASSTTTTYMTKTSSETSRAITSNTTPDLDKCTNKICVESETKVKPNFQSVLVGATATIECTKNSNNSEDLRYIWRWTPKNGFEEILESDNNTIQLDAQLDHTGQYKCTVQDKNGCCKDSSATAELVVYEKPLYWIHITVLVGISLGLMLFACIPMTIILRRKYWHMKDFKSREDNQILTL